MDARREIGKARLADTMHTLALEPMLVVSYINCSSRAPIYPGQRASWDA
jgi:hypothetical protein